MPPQTLSHYRILEPLGAGGMGEVFKAQDTKLEREVALKLLPPESVSDPERLSRFKQEALATSALNHPNITTIFEIDEAEGQHFISLEYVQGRTLRSLMAQGRLEVRELLAAAVQVAEGLHAAHQAGVVHRDLKPDNIMVRDDGITKILDFGLAKLAANDPPSDQDETMLAAPGSDSLTRPGVVMGTVAYMSPEQARGQHVDHRSDIFSFGSILYEMIAGTPPFTADSSVEVMHALIRDQPRALQDLDSGVPAELVRIIRKAMSKSPDERYQTAKDMAIDLRTLKREIDSGSLSSVHSAASGPTPVAPPSSGRPLAVVVGVAVVLVLAVAVFFMRGREGPAPAPEALSISKITASGQAGSPAFSRDGRFVAFDTEVDGQESIRVRQMATGSEVEIVPPREDVVLGNIEFSPDGDWVLYTARNVNERQRKLWRVSSLGGTPREVLPDVDSQPSFSPDGQSFIFGRFVERATYFLTASFTEVGGEPQEVYSAPENAMFILAPRWSSAGDLAYVQIDKGEVLYPKLMIKPMDGGEPQLAPGPRWMQLVGISWSPDGSELFVCGARSWIERPQIWSLRPASGQARRITSDFHIYSGVAPRGDGEALVAQRTTYNSHLWMLRTEELPLDGASAQRITRGTDDSGTPDVHPDGTRVLFESDADGDLNLWTMDLDGSNRAQLTFGAAQDFWARWSPDGELIAYGSEADGSLHVWTVNADGSNARALTQVGNANYAPSFSPDGEWIAYVASEGDSSCVYKVPAKGGERIRVSQTQGMMVAEWSPDGRWIATWGADNPASPRQKVMLLPTREGDEEHSIEVTVRGRFEMLNLRWHPGGELALALSVDGTPNVHLLEVPDGTPRQITDFQGDELLFAHDWSPDGKFLIAQRGVVSSDIVLVENLP